MYPYNKSTAWNMLAWQFMENCQDSYPYLWLGWYGIIFMVYYPGIEHNCEEDMADEIFL